MHPIDLEKEVKDLKRRVDLAETKIAQQAGQFEFITGQLRDVQLYMHARFADIDLRLDSLETKIDALPRVIAEMNAKIDALPRVIAEMETKIDALPRVIAEMIAPRP